MMTIVFGVHAPVRSEAHWKADPVKKKKQEVSIAKHHRSTVLHHGVTPQKSFDLGSLAFETASDDNRLCSPCTILHPDIATPKYLLYACP
jgi:hypothetical protein